jgi:hypothetical protein
LNGKPLLSGSDLDMFDDQSVLWLLFDCTNFVSVRPEKNVDLKTGFLRFSFLDINRRQNRL